MKRIIFSKLLTTSSLPRSYVIIATAMQRDDQIEKWKQRDFSWSQYSSFKYSPEQWFYKYILNQGEDPNPAMVFGNVVGDSLGTPTSLVPKLNPHLVGIKEYEMRAEMNGFKLVGFADHYCPETKVLNENKTSQKHDRWDQNAVDAHGQLTFYALLLLLKDKVMPHELTIWLNFIHVAEGGDFKLYIPNPDNFKRFQTKRAIVDVVRFGDSITKITKKMELYALTH